MRSQLVSVVVPTYCRPQKVRECLLALVGQSLSEPWEVILVDDGSPTPVVDSLGNVITDNLALKVIRQENAGPAVARNAGVRHARGEFVAFTDDDCLPTPNWLETLVQAGRENPEALVGGTTFNGIPQELFASTSQLIIDMVYQHSNVDPENAYFLASNNFLCQRNKFLTIGGFDKSFRRAGAEDRDLCDRWRAAGGPLVWRPAARVEHRHSQSLRSFAHLHFRYGRGAHVYQRKRRERGSGTMKEDLGFHRSLPTRLACVLEGQPAFRSQLSLLAAMLLWQGANAAGFAFEALASRVPPRS